VTRICIVSGGSAYMPGIAFALARASERFSEATIVLHDIDAEAYLDAHADRLEAFA
jgi:alpha-galactosidase/6-phospho-beta-glucosidase family protein